MIIGTMEDVQCEILFEVSKPIANRTIFLNAGSYDIDWRLSLSNEQGSFVICQKFGYLKLDDPTICWYLRGPTLGDQYSSQLYFELHQALSLYAYPIGNYLIKGPEEALTESKLNQYKVWEIGALPEVIVTNKLAAARSKKESSKVIKSLSTIRSIATNLNSNSLLWNLQELSNPVQLQSKVDGLNVKVHYYRSRAGYWHTLSISSVGNEVDYRYDPIVSFGVVPTKPHWIKKAESIYEQFGSRFFDVDLIVGEEKEYFLEVNFSPAPVCFERFIFEDSYVYTKLFLLDWLCKA